MISDFINDISNSIDTVVVRNYETGAELAHILNKSLRIFTLAQEFIEYANQDICIFAPAIIDLESELKKIELQKIFLVKKVSSDLNNPKQVEDLVNLFEIVEKYKYICIDDQDLKRLVARAVGGLFFEVCEYAQSMEGNFWFKLSSLLEQPYSSGVFDYMDFDHINVKNSMPYMQYSNLKEFPQLKLLENLIELKQFREIFRLFHTNEPHWVPKDLEDFKNVPNLLAIQKHQTTNARVFIDKTLAQYVNAPVLYVGSNGGEFDELAFGITEHIIYDPKFQKHSKWDIRHLPKPEIKTVYDEQLYANGEWSKLYARNLGLKLTQKNIYGYIKKCAIDDIKFAVFNGLRGGIEFNKAHDQRLINSDEKCETETNVCQNSRNANWKVWLKKSGLKYIKILTKANNLIDNFFEICADYRFVSFDVSFEDTVIDCILENDRDMCAVIFSWSHVVYKSDCRIKKIVEMRANLELGFGKHFHKLIVVTTEKIIHVPVDAKFDIKQKDKIKEIFDDLFYWQYR